MTTYDPADINDAEPEAVRRRLPRQHHRRFLDDPTDKAATAARRKALLDFVRGGKGLAGIHAAPIRTTAPRAPRVRRRRAAPAADSAADAAAPATRRGDAGEPGRQERGPEGQPRRTERAGRCLVRQARSGEDRKVAQADFPQRFAALSPQPAAPAAAAGGAVALREADRLWPEFNKMIGGFFKFHWNDPQEITFKIDDPKSPLTAMFKGAAAGRSTTRPTRSARTRSRARTSTCSRASTTRR